MDRDQLVEHLKFAADLGVAGVSRDPVWRARADEAALQPIQGERGGIVVPVEQDPPSIAPDRKSVV